MQNAVPLQESQKIDLTQLTEEQARAKLDKQIDDLSDEIDTLQKEIFWETVGQAGIGIIGGVTVITILVVDGWNPTGWVVAGLVAGATVGGEIALAEDKAKKGAELTLDKEQLALSKEEEDLLKPYYSIQNQAKMLENLVSYLTKISAALGVMKSDYQTAADDVEAFLKDLTVKDFEDLEFDYNDVIGDFDQICTDANVLLGSPTTQTVTPKQMTELFNKAKPGQASGL